jgi:DNA-binding transcriptional MerR regulator
MAGIPEVTFERNARLSERSATSRPPMKISELSDSSGVAVATIKFYLREGLLPAGRRSAPNQAQYGKTHLARLDLIRVLQKKAGMSLADIGEVARAIDEAAKGRADFIAVAADRLPLGYTIGDDIATDSDEFLAAQERLRAAVARHSWLARESAPAWNQTVRAIAVIDAEWEPLGDDRIDMYMARLGRIAADEVREANISSSGPEESIRFIALGTVLIEPLLLGLRRLAHFNSAANAQRSQ